MAVRWTVTPSPSPRPGRSWPAQRRAVASRRRPPLGRRAARHVAHGHAAPRPEARLRRLGEPQRLDRVSRPRLRLLALAERAHERLQLAPVGLLEAHEEVALEV